MTDGFRWHPEARLFAEAGREVRPSPAPAAATGAVLPDSAEGLAEAIGLPAFRIGALGEPAPQCADKPILETLTSGSTGTPRRIRRTQTSWIASFAVNAGFGIGPGARVAVLGPLVQSLALYAAVEGLHLGAEVRLMNLRRPDQSGRLLSARRITHLYATPAQLRFLVETGTSWPDLAQVLVGGAKLDAALRVAVQRLAPGAQVTEFYGAAETSFVTLTDAATPEGSVGRAYPGVEISVDHAGAIWVKSPYLFLSYANEIQPPVGKALASPPVGTGEDGGPLARVPPIQTPTHIAPVPSTPLQAPRGGSEAPDATGSALWRDGWLSVGEVGRREAGYLYLHGRAGRMVTVADHNVFPEEIEALMHGMPGILRAAVVPVPDTRRGHVLVAMVMGDPALEATILTGLRRELGALKAPKALIWLSDWPLLPSGKTDLRALEAQAKWPV